MSCWITKERKLELRKLAAEAARGAVTVLASSLNTDSEEAEYTQRYMAKLAERITHNIFVDDAELYEDKELPSSRWTP